MKTNRDYSATSRLWKLTEHLVLFCNDIALSILFDYKHTAKFCRCYIIVLLIALSIALSVQM